MPCSTPAHKALQQQGRSNTDMKLMSDEDRRDQDVPSPRALLQSFFFLFLNVFVDWFPKDTGLVQLHSLPLCVSACAYVCMTACLPISSPPPPPPNISTNTSAMPTASQTGTQFTKIVSFHHFMEMCNQAEERQNSRFCFVSFLSKWFDWRAV